VVLEHSASGPRAGDNPGPLAPTPIAGFPGGPNRDLQPYGADRCCKADRIADLAVYAGPRNGAGKTPHMVERSALGRLRGIAP